MRYKWFILFLTLWIMYTPFNMEVNDYMIIGVMLLTWYYRRIGGSDEWQQK